MPKITTTPEPIELWELLVPTKFEDTKKPIRLRHHKIFDEHVKKISGGMTVLHPAKGYWIDTSNNKEYEDRMIPVRFTASRSQLNKIIQFTIKHYRQIAVMAYKISSEVLIVRADV